MEKKLQATARVQVTVEVESGVWGGDCSIEQLYDQAAREGLQTVRSAMQKSATRCSIIGEPKVLGVITERS